MITGIAPKNGYICVLENISNKEEPEWMIRDVIEIRKGDNLLAKVVETEYGESIDWNKLKEERQGSDFISLIESEVWFYVDKSFHKLWNKDIDKELQLNELGYYWDDSEWAGGSDDDLHDFIRGTWAKIAREYEIK